MCIIIYTPDGNIPRKHLQRSLHANPDGWGFMFARKGHLVIRKGMSNRAFWSAWREEKPSGPTVFHARIGTQGTKSEKNCHPFPVPNHELAMCHNGILRQHCDSESPVSDTQLFVWDVLANLPTGFLDNEGIQALLSHYAGNGKLVFMDGKGNVAIINEHIGYWHSGRWYSNSSYRPPVVEVLKPMDLLLLKNRTFAQSKPFWEVPQNGYPKRELTASRD